MFIPYNLQVFNSNQQLVIHRTTHEKDKNHLRCEKCGNTFNNSDEMETHEQLGCDTIFTIITE